MKKKITFAICGVGNRGTRYANAQNKFGDDMQVVAIADLKPDRMESVNKFLHLPADRMFASADEMFAAGKLADILVVSTQDQQHREHALKGMELGYDLLLEKPIAANLEDVVMITETARKLGRTVFICHVLRYTPFYRMVKKLIDEGVVGKVETIDAAEQVGYYHIAHSYVRGNWHKEATSSPMILAKCCHDMDLFLWLTGKSCKSVSSFGSLDYFTAENKPEGAAERCMDCKLDCPYHAPTFYLSTIPGWPANVLQPEPTEENILETLKTSDYGKCVFAMDNDVVDHQVVNLLLEGGVTVNFSMTGFNNIQTRTIRVMGTEGEIWGDFDANELYWQRYHKECHKVDVASMAADFSGHGGGDEGLVYDVIRYMRGDDFDSTSVTTIARSAESHYVAFAAEKSRVEEGELIRMKSFMEGLIAE